MSRRWLEYVEVIGFLSLAVVVVGIFGYIHTLLTVDQQAQAQAPTGSTPLEPLGDSRIWTSEHWCIDEVRSLTSNVKDPYDPSGWSEKRSSGTIDFPGDCTMRVSGGASATPRLYLDGTPHKFWHNVEATAYVSGSMHSGGSVKFGLRTSPLGHSDAPCNAKTYWFNLLEIGDARMFKELRHPDGKNRLGPEIWGGAPWPTNQWHGLRAVAYNTATGDVQLELWYDDSGNGSNWVLLQSELDNGGWSMPLGVGDCPYAADHVIAEGGGVVLLRVNKPNDIWISDMKVTEIAP